MVDYSLSNQSRTNFRTELNNHLTAIVENNKSATAPSPAFAYMLWADTTANKLKIRNGANSAWFEIGDLDTANLGLLTNTASVITTSLLANSNVTLAKLANGTADKFIGFDGSGNPVEKDQLSGGLEVFSSSGTFTVPAGVTTIFCEIRGASGGGGRGTASVGGGGGGSGEFFRFTKTVTPAAEMTVTLGAGGAGGNSGGTTGITGGDTTFASTIIKGGAGGIGGVSGGAGGVGGSGGTESGTTLLFLSGIAGGASSGATGGGGSYPPTIDSSLSSTGAGDLSTGGSGGNGLTDGNAGGGGQITIWF